MSTSFIRQNYQGINNPQKFQSYRSNNNMFLQETYHSMLHSKSSLAMTHHFASTLFKYFLGKIGKHSFKKKTGNPPKDSKSSEATINEIMETITSKENDVNSKTPTQESTNEEDLLNLLSSTLTLPSLHQIY